MRATQAVPCLPCGHKMHEAASASIVSARPSARAVSARGAAQHSAGLSRARLGAPRVAPDASEELRRGTGWGAERGLLAVGEPPRRGAGVASPAVNKACSSGTYAEDQRRAERKMRHSLGTLARSYLTPRAIVPQVSHAFSVGIWILVIPEEFSQNGQRSSLRFLKSNSLPNRYVVGLQEVPHKGPTDQACSLSSDRMRR